MRPRTLATVTMTLLVLPLVAPLAQGDAPFNLVALEVQVSSSGFHEGEPLTFYGLVENQANTTASNVTVHLLLNGTLWRSRTVDVGSNSTHVRYVDFGSAHLSRGNYTATLVVDPSDNHTESNESDNTISRSFTVLPPVPPPLPADLTVEILTLDSVPLRTDLGDVRDPRGPHVATGRVCNVGGSPANTTLDLTVFGRTAGWDNVTLLRMGWIGAGSCAAWNTTFNTVNVVGDFRLLARAQTAAYESSRANNEAVRESYTWVAGQGGVAVPFP